MKYNIILVLFTIILVGCTTTVSETAPATESDADQEAVDTPEEGDTSSEEEAAAPETDTPPESIDPIPPETSGGEVREINVIAKQWDFDPNEIIVSQGDTVKLTVTSIDVNHGFAIPAYGIDEFLSPGDEVAFEFVADKKGSFPFLCSVVCGSGHGRMRGTLVVE